MKRKYLCTVGEIVSWCNSMDNSMEFPQKVKSRNITGSSNLTSGLFTEGKRNTSSKVYIWMYMQHYFGEENGNPLQCSCLESNRVGGAWWAAIYGVTQSQTRLKWLGSSSNIYIHVVHGVAKSDTTVTLTSPHLEEGWQPTPELLLGELL